MKCSLRKNPRGTTLLRSSGQDPVVLVKWMPRPGNGPHRVRLFLQTLILCCVLLMSFTLLAGSAAVPNGQVEIRTSPGAEVIWDGVPIGTANAQGILVISEIPSGEYSIECRKNGFVSDSTTIQIDLEGVAVDLVLQPIAIETPQPKAKAPEPVVAAPSGSSESARSAVPKPAAKREEAPTRNDRVEPVKRSQAAAATGMSTDESKRPDSSVRSMTPADEATSSSVATDTGTDVAVGAEDSNPAFGGYRSFPVSGEFATIPIVVLLGAAGFCFYRFLYRGKVVPQAAGDHLLEEGAPERTPAPPQSPAPRDRSADSAFLRELKDDEITAEESAAPESPPEPTVRKVTIIDVEPEATSD